MQGGKQLKMFGFREVVEKTKLTSFLSTACAQERHGSEQGRGNTGWLPHLQDRQHGADQILQLLAL